MKRLLTGVAMLAVLVTVGGCGYSDPPPKEACAAHGGVNYPGDELWIDFPSFRIYYRTTCKDGEVVETGGN